jgi:hypothetical protein
MGGQNCVSTTGGIVSLLLSSLGNGGPSGTSRRLTNPRNISKANNPRTRSFFRDCLHTRRVQDDPVFASTSQLSSVGRRWERGRVRRGGEMGSDSILTDNKRMEHTTGRLTMYDWESTEVRTSKDWTFCQRNLYPAVNLPQASQPMLCACGCILTAKFPTMCNHNPCLWGSLRCRDSPRSLRHAYAQQNCKSTTGTSVGQFAPPRAPRRA